MLDWVVNTLLAESFLTFLMRESKRAMSQKLSSNFQDAIVFKMENDRVFKKILYMYLLFFNVQLKTFKRISSFAIIKAITDVDISNRANLFNFKVNNKSTILYYNVILTVIAKTFCYIILCDLKIRNTKLVVTNRCFFLVSIYKLPH